jgi:hypothetical protein
VLTVGETAEKLMVALRDGRKLIGVLRSWDQFGGFSFLTLMNLEGAELARTRFSDMQTQPTSSSNPRSSASLRLSPNRQAATNRQVSTPT